MGSGPDAGAGPRGVSERPLCTVGLADTGWAGSALQRLSLVEKVKGEAADREEAQVEGKVQGTQGSGS